MERNEQIVNYREVNNQFNNSVMDENKVIIYYWKGDYIHKNPENPGHIAIEIPCRNFYFSFWPKQHTSRVEVNTCPTDRDHLHEKEIDLHIVESKPPNIVIKFTQLDIEAIVKKGRYIKKMIDSGQLIWKVYPSVLWGLFSSNGGNCCTVSYELLLAGGLDKLANSYELNTTSVFLYSLPSFALHWILKTTPLNPLYSRPLKLKKEFSFMETPLNLFYGFLMGHYTNTFMRWTYPIRYLGLLVPIATFVESLKGNNPSKLEPLSALFFYAFIDLTLRHFKDPLSLAFNPNRFLEIIIKASNVEKKNSTNFPKNKSYLSKLLSFFSKSNENNNEDNLRNRYINFTNTR